jgi:large subunit ribosomal protein L29
MKAKELRELNDEELERKLTDTRQELFNLRFQSVTGALENTARIERVKRDIARILTIRGERQAALERQ